MIGRSDWLPLLLVSSAMVLMVGYARTSSSDEPKIVSLFNGTDLSGWQGDPRFWTVHDGVLVGRSPDSTPLTRDAVLFWSGHLRDFDLRLAVRVVSGRAGIQYRSRRLPSDSVAGYSLDLAPASLGGLTEEKMRKRLARPGEKVLLIVTGEKRVVGKLPRPERPDRPDAWHEITIRARGDRWIHELDGQVIVDVTDEDGRYFAEEGLLALRLSEGTAAEVHFKDIRLKHFGAPPDPTDRSAPRRKQSVAKFERNVPRPRATRCGARVEYRSSARRRSR